MPAHLKACRNALNHHCSSSKTRQVTKVSSSVWVSDDLLSSTYNAFVSNRQHIRYGSCIPGPLEARRRQLGRKATTVTRTQQSWGVLNPAVVQDFKPENGWWGSSQLVEKDASGLHPPWMSWLGGFAGRPPPAPVPTPVSGVDVEVPHKGAFRVPAHVAVLPNNALFWGNEQVEEEFELLLLRQLENCKNYDDLCYKLSDLEAKFSQYPSSTWPVLRHTLENGWPCEETRKVLLDPNFNPYNSQNHVLFVQSEDLNAQLVQEILLSQTIPEAAGLGLMSDRDIVGVMRVISAPESQHGKAFDSADFFLRLLDAISNSPVLEMKESLMSELHLLAISLPWTASKVALLHRFRTGSMAESSSDLCSALFTSLTETRNPLMDADLMALLEYANCQPHLVNRTNLIQLTDDLSNWTGEHKDTRPIEIWSKFLPGIGYSEAPEAGLLADTMAKYMQCSSIRGDGERLLIMLWTNLLWNGKKFDGCLMAREIERCWCPASSPQHADPLASILQDAKTLCLPDMDGLLAHIVELAPFHMDIRADFETLENYRERLHEGRIETLLDHKAYQVIRVCFGSILTRLTDDITSDLERFQKTAMALVNQGHDGTLLLRRILDHSIAFKLSLRNTLSLRTLKPDANKTCPAKVLADIAMACARNESHTVLSAQEKTRYFFHYLHKHAPRVPPQMYHALCHAFVTRGNGGRNATVKWLHKSASENVNAEFADSLFRSAVNQDLPSISKLPRRISTPFRGAVSSPVVAGNFVPSQTANSLLVGQLTFDSKDISHDNPPVKSASITVTPHLPPSTAKSAPTAQARPSKDSESKLRDQTSNPNLKSCKISYIGARTQRYNPSSTIIARARRSTNPRLQQQGHRSTAAPQQKPSFQDWSLTLNVKEKDTSKITHAQGENHTTKSATTNHQKRVDMYIYITRYVDT